MANGFLRFLLTLCPLLAQAPGLAPSALSLGPQRTVASPWSISRGHFQVTLQTGTATEVRDSDGSLGFFLEGRLTFSYTSLDPREHPSMKWNQERTGHLKTESYPGVSMRIAGHVERMLIWAPVGSLPTLPTGPELEGSASAKAFQQHHLRFSRRGGFTPWSLLARARYNTSSQPFLMAQIEGEDDFVYCYDPNWGMEESFHLRRDSIANTPDEQDGLNALVPLSTQPIGRPVGEVRPRRLVQDKMDLDIRAMRDGEAKVRAKVHYRVLHGPVRLLSFEFEDRTYKSTRAGTLLNLDRTMTRVLDQAGKPLPFQVLPGELLVLLPEVAKAGDSLELTFETSGSPLNFVGGDNAWRLSAEPWLPRTSLYEIRQKVHAVVHTQLPHRPVAPGRVIKEWEEGGFAHQEVQLDQASAFFAVLGGAYTIQVEVRNGRRLRIATYGLLGGNHQTLANLAAESIRFYETFLGPFPSEEFLIAQVNDYGWGQAPPSMMFITNEAFRPGDGLWNRIFSSGINHRFAHEIAHQYWGHAVMWESEEETWLSEAFADYSSSLVIAAAKGTNGRNSLIAGWREDAKECQSIGTIPMANRLYDPVRPGFSNRFRTFLLYRKGPLLLYKIHKEIGDSAFLTFLKSYQASFRGEDQWGNTKHVKGLLEVITKRSWDSFFNAHYDGTGLPSE